MTAFRPWKYIHLPVFIMSFLIGLLGVYLTTDNRKIVIYPTPENIGHIQYRDATDTCFDFQQTELACPKNDREITRIPSQV